MAIFLVGHFYVDHSRRITRTGSVNYHREVVRSTFKHTLTKWSVKLQSSGGNSPGLRLTLTWTGINCMEYLYGMIVTFHNITSFFCRLPLLQEPLPEDEKVTNPEIGFFRKEFLISFHTQIYILNILKAKPDTKVSPSISFRLYGDFNFFYFTAAVHLGSLGPNRQINISEIQQREHGIDSI